MARGDLATDLHLDLIVDLIVGTVFQRVLVQPSPLVGRLGEQPLALVFDGRLPAAETLPEPGDDPRM